MIRNALSWLALAAVPTLAHAQQAPRLGVIEFPTSGRPEAQEPFVRGVLYLHSFEYRSAAESFRRAQEVDPGFAMAYWGEAMTYTHPVWNEQDRDAARTVLKRLGTTPEARRARAPTAREQAYLEAVEILYGEGSKAERDTAYSFAMERLVAAYPDDDETRAFYALSLLGLNQAVRDIPTYMRAAAVVEDVFLENPRHPGAAHYLIHSFDDPIHAALGLRAARAYSEIAPDAAHAQHMTTHIFVAMGMWDDVVSQNRIAAGLTAWVPGHYTSWLGYGLLQQGRHRDAGTHLERVRQNMPQAPTSGQRGYLVTMRAHQVVNTERWDDPIVGWSIDHTALSAGVRAIDAFTLGFAALKRGDREGAQRHLATLAGQPGGSTTRDAYGTSAQVPKILARELDAALRLAGGDGDGAVALLREATRLEDDLPLEYGPPDVVKPSHELLGEVLLGLGRPQEAQREFARALELAPKRALALLGLGRAAAKAGDRKTALRAYGQLRQIWHDADPNLPGLEEAARFVASR